MKKLPGSQIWIDETPLPLEFGGRLPRIEVEYETWGHLCAKRDNAVLICPAFSAHSHARSSQANPTRGWWEGLIGPGRAFDTDRFFVVCSSLLGGSYGTTGPLSDDPMTGRPYRGTFPVVSVRDIIEVWTRLLDQLGIERLFAAAGGSLGGMEALQLAVSQPQRLKRMIIIAATERTRPYTAVIRRIGRRAILADPEFQDGQYETNPREGLRLARELGTIYYRSRPEFNQRFSCRPLDPENIRFGAINFDFESYLNHQGSKAPDLFDANSYLRLSLAMDLHDITRGWDEPGDAYRQIQARSLVMGTPQDLLIPFDEQSQIHDRLQAAGKEVEWQELSSLYGHDGFLKEFDQLNPIMKAFLDST